MEIIQLVNSIICFLSGGVLVAVVNLKSTEKQIKFNKEKMVFKANEKDKEINNRIKNLNREYIIENIELIKFRNSLTQNFIMERVDFTELDVHKKYLVQEKKLMKIIVKARMTHSEIVDDLDLLNGLCNKIWSKQKNYFANSKNEIVTKNIIGSELIECFNEVAILCRKILYELSC